LNATANRLVSRLHGLAGLSLLETIRDSSHHLHASSAGHGTSGKCPGLVHDTPNAALLNPALPRELEQLSSGELAKGIRLACLARFQQNGELDQNANVLQLDRLIREQLTRFGCKAHELDVVAVEEGGPVGTLSTSGNSLSVEFTPHIFPANPFPEAHHEDSTSPKDRHPPHHR